MDSPMYRIEDGTRHVVPYCFTYKMNCKGRWIGRTVLSVFSVERAGRVVLSLVRAGGVWKR